MPKFWKFDGIMHISMSLQSIVWFLLTVDFNRVSPLVVYIEDGIRAVFHSCLQNSNWKRYSFEKISGTAKRRGFWQVIHGSFLCSRQLFLSTFLFLGCLYLPLLSWRSIASGCFVQDYRLYNARKRSLLKCKIHWSFINWSEYLIQWVFSE